LSFSSEFTCLLTQRIMHTTFITHLHWGRVRSDLLVWIIKRLLIQINSMLQREPVLSWPLTFDFFLKIRQRRRDDSDCMHHAEPQIFPLSRSSSHQFPITLDSQSLKSQIFWFDCWELKQLGIIMIWQFPIPSQTPPTQTEGVGLYVKLNYFSSLPLIMYYLLPPFFRWVFRNLFGCF